MLTGLMRHKFFLTRVKGTFHVRGGKIEDSLVVKREVELTVSFEQLEGGAAVVVVD